MRERQLFFFSDIIRPSTNLADSQANINKRTRKCLVYNYRFSLFLQRECDIIRRVTVSSRLAASKEIDRECEGRASRNAPTAHSRTWRWLPYEDSRENLWARIKLYFERE